MLVFGINEKIDMVMVERLASDREAGIYGAAYRWVDAVMMYSAIILPLFFAKFAAAIKAPVEQEKLLRFGQVVLGIPLIFVCVFVFFYGRLLFWQFSASSEQEINTMQLNLQILFAYVLVQGFFAIYSTLLTSTNYEKQVIWLVIFSIVLNIVLNALFIPAYGSVASATATLLCGVIVSVGYLFLMAREVKISIPADIITRLIVATLLLTGIFKVLSSLSEAWFWNTVAAGLLYIPCLFLLRLVRWQELRVFVFNRN
jgi:O-antigen/teichoic acid export membrane protein